MALKKKSPKYKKVIKAILPSQPNGEMNKSNISKLVYFCETNPELLQKVGLYIQLKIEKNLKKKKYGFVTCCLIVIRELIVGCKKNLIFFAENATKIMKLLLEQDVNQDLQIEATETFIQFVSVLDSSQTNYQEIEGFIQYFINMCKNGNNDHHRRRRIRCEGLKGVTAYITILDLMDELDSYISRHPEIISTILDNMQYRDQIITNTTNATNNNTGLTTPPITPTQPERRNTLQDINNNNNNQQSNPTSTSTTTSTTTQPAAAAETDDHQYNVKEVATDSLRDLTRRVDNITVTSLVQTILGYLDQQQKWGDDNFSTFAMVAMAESIKTQQYTILLTSYLRHLEPQHPPPVTKEIVNTAVAITNDHSGSVNMVVSHFIKIMIQSIDIANKKPPPADVDEQFKLQSAIIEAVGKVCRKLSNNRSRMEIMIQIMSQAKEEYIRPGQGESNVILLDIVQCTLQVSQTLTDVIPHTLLNDFLQRKLLPLAEHPSSEVRIYVQKILHSLLLPGGRSLDQLQLQPIDGVDELLMENGTFIRDSLFIGFMISNNHPDNIASLFKTLVIMLYRGRNKELQHSIPMIFRIQRILLKKKVSFRLSSSIHLTIASYLYIISKFYDIPELEKYIDNIIKIRKEKGQSCKYLSFDFQQLKLIVKQNKNKYREREKIKDASCEEINQDFVAEKLCEIKSLTQEFNDLPKILKKKYNTITRNDLELPQDEGVELSPPVKTIALLGSNENISTNNIISHPKILTFDSFKQYAIYFDDSPSSLKSNIGNTSSTANTAGGVGHHANGGTNTSRGTSSHSSNSPPNRHQINNTLLTKDLTYLHVVSICEENGNANQKEQDLLMRLVLQTDHDNTTTTTSSLNNVLDDNVDDELSSTCTLKMNIQTVLEKVF